MPANGWRLGQGAEIERWTSVALLIHGRQPHVRHASERRATADHRQQPTIRRTTRC